MEAFADIMFAFRGSSEWFASNELESDSISGWNLTQAYNNRLDLGAYRTYYKGFTCFFNNTVLRGAGLNGCAIFVRKYWDRTV